MKNDLEILKDVVSQVQWDPFLNSLDILISVRNGIVTLSGMVDSYAQKIAAEKAALKVSGVRAIARDIQLTVKRSPQSDREISDAAMNALKCNSALTGTRIRVQVLNGNALLDGEVEWEYQRQIARKVIGGLVGVRRLTNNIAVKKQPLIYDIRSSIQKALQRYATVDAEKIIIRVEGSKVILEGKVNSYAAREDAQAAAWCAPGVALVENKLEIEPARSSVFQPGRLFNDLVIKY